MLADIGWQTTVDCDPEPALEDIFDDLGFAGLVEIDQFMFPPGDYEAEILAEFSTSSTYLIAFEDYEDGGFQDFVFRLTGR